MLLNGASLEATILCGGLGTRLRGVLPNRPKTLATVCGRPFLVYLLDQLAAAGITEATLATGYLADQVQTLFQDYYRGIHLRYSQEKEPLGTGGAIRLANGSADYTLVMNGDSYCDTQLASFIDRHFRQNHRNSMAVTRVEDVRRFGSVDVGEDGQILAFREKATEQNGGPVAGLINAGIYLLSRELIETMQTGTAVSLEREVFPAHLAELRALQVDGKFIDIGTPESYAAATEFFSGMAGEPTGIIFLDRDGTVNVEQDHLAHVDGMELIPGAAEAIRDLRKLGMPLVVVSNQTVIARGDCSLETLKSINARMIDLLEAEGATVDGIYYCPHGKDEGCECRKPKTGLLKNAAQVFDADLTRSFVIGDKWSDILAGTTVGATTILVRTGHGNHPDHTRKSSPDYITQDLAEAARQVIEIRRRGMDALSLIRQHFKESANVKLALADSAGSQIAEAATQIANAVANGGKVMLCGNGGSAADSQHIAAEFTSRLRASMERPAIAALALTTDSSFLTARGNDYGFDDIFERLIDALGRPGDVLVGISTSGGSVNVLRAVCRAKDKGIFTVGLTGGTGGELAKVSDLAIVVPSFSTQHIQESHIAIGHIVCELVEESLYGSDQTSAVDTNFSVEAKL